MVNPAAKKKSVASIGSGFFFLTGYLAYLPQRNAYTYAERMHLRIPLFKELGQHIGEIHVKIFPACVEGQFNRHFILVGKFVAFEADIPVHTLLVLQQRSVFPNIFGVDVGD